ncbi:MAG: helix-turn-helix transcriptional regulator [Caldimonas sp.]
MSGPVPSIRFDRRKYGRHLLADACAVDSLPFFIQTPRLHRLAFYEVVLITEGRGALALDGAAIEVAPYRVCITAPGEIRSWLLEGTRLGGLLAFFEAELFDEAFADPHFVASLPLVDAAPGERSFAVDRRRFDALAGIIASMSDELRAPDGHTAHLLHARTSELLIGLQRQSGTRAKASAPRARALARRFGALVDARFHRNEPVARYAEALGVSPRHLNQCVRASTGLTASETIQQRLHLEARRLLMQSALPVGAIAEALGFSDAPYFIRFFKRHAALTPGEFRAVHESAVVDPVRPLPAPEG